MPPGPPLPAPAGPTRLSQARAEARLSEAQQLSFSVEVVPAEGHRQAGYVRAAGVVPLAEAAAGGGGGSGQQAGTAHALQTAQAAAAQQMDVRLSVKDGGMAVLTSVTPDVQWLGGQAAIDVRLRGPPDRPVLSGAASLSKASLDCPVLRFPLTGVTAEVRAGGDLLTVEALEARCGRRGNIRARGSLPVYGAGAAGGTQQGAAGPPPLRLTAEASGLELRVRNLYSGQYDASLAVAGSLAQPSVGGSMRFSRGIVFIVPQGAPGEGAAHAGGPLFGRCERQRMGLAGLETKAEVCCAGCRLTPPGSLHLLAPVAHRALFCSPAPLRRRGGHRAGRRRHAADSQRRRRRQRAATAAAGLLRDQGLRHPDARRERAGATV